MKVCSVEGCDHDDVIARGFCQMHYQRWYRTGPLGGGRERQGAPCQVEGCVRQSHTRGYCQAHYNRLRTTGSTGNAAFAAPVAVTGHVTTDKLSSGLMLSTWATRRGCTTARADRLANLHRWRYGSYRPSFLQDGIALPDMTDDLGMAAD